MERIFQRWPFAYYVAAVIENFSRKVVDKEGQTREREKVFRYYLEIFSMRGLGTNACLDTLSLSVANL